MLSHSQHDIANSNFYALSLDEASALGRASFLCVHLYIVRDWRREAIFLGLKEVSAPAYSKCTRARSHARTHTRKHTQSFAQHPISLPCSQVTDAPSAATVGDMVQACLKDAASLSVERQQQRIVGVASDGASVMTGGCRCRAEGAARMAAP